MTRTIAAAVLLSLTMFALPAFADDGNAAPLTIGASARLGQAVRRPAVLPALYASYAALQAYDVFSTKQGLARGAREANPLMDGVVGHTSTFVALKVTAAVGTMVMAERLWKTNKVGAIAVMAASNGVAAVVAARNARTLRQLR